jgi:small subunit ribosomal protein S20
LTQGLVDKACRKGVMHKNAANRAKSRLAAKVNNLA